MSDGVTAQLMKGHYLRGSFSTLPRGDIYNAVRIVKTTHTDLLSAVSTDGRYIVFVYNQANDL